MASSGLGTMIVRSLASQLNGQVDWIKNGGMVARLEFPAAA
jgi:two-component sensor histidine kinase